MEGAYESVRKLDAFSGLLRLLTIGIQLICRLMHVRLLANRWFMHTYVLTINWEFMKGAG
jgi:hypothetical protein